MKTQGSYSHLKTLGDVIEDRPVMTFPAEDSLPDVLITKKNIMRHVALPLKRQSARSDNLYRFRSIESLTALNVIISESEMRHRGDRIYGAPKSLDVPVDVAMTGCISRSMVRSNSEFARA